MSLRPPRFLAFCLSLVLFLLISILSARSNAATSPSSFTQNAPICPPRPNEFPSTDPSISKKQGSGAVRLTFERVYIPDGLSFYLKASPLENQIMQNRALDSGSEARITWNDERTLSTMKYSQNVWQSKKFFFNRNYTVKRAGQRCNFIDFYVDIPMGDFAKHAKKEPMKEGGVRMTLELWFGWLKGKDADRNWIKQERKIEVDVTVAMRPPPEIRQEL